jgi:hypothetical protein
MFLACPHVTKPWLGRRRPKTRGLSRQKFAKPRGCAARLEAPIANRCFADLGVRAATLTAHSSAPGTDAMTRDYRCVDTSKYYDLQRTRFADSAPFRP